jgi:hypothetical protein
MVRGMETTTQTTPRTIDVSGLPEEAIRAVESIVTLLRPKGQAASMPPSVEEWSRALRAWAASHPRLDQAADDSRESIYEGRGE